eukprot:TRINITY_DN12237_c0_g1_i2.p1 TRINITY_DN12237_c0_g1~~TRINITY_DN12237_c0_g1_i2.p1  ORF type:complete len:217 (-),score=26.91 TRINITY_DN12237_c0_g1_i2:49-657(-)
MCIRDRVSTQSTWGSRKFLIDSYVDLHKLSLESVSEIFKKEFAPLELSSGWAEPFVGQMTLWHFGIKTELSAVNKIPGNANAPPEVFSHGRIYSFKEFVKRLLDHFSSTSERASPVMIDDGLMAATIIGVGVHSDSIYLWMADPHLEEGVKPGFGMYYVQMDENGKQLFSSILADDRKYYYCKGGDRHLNFTEKGWMVLIQF